MASFANYITPGGYRRLREELTRLWKEERPATVAAVTWAGSNGDRSENGDHIYGCRRPSTGATSSSTGSRSTRKPTRYPRCSCGVPVTTILIPTSPASTSPVSSTACPEKVATSTAAAATGPNARVRRYSGRSCRYHRHAR